MLRGSLSAVLVAGVFAACGGSSSGSTEPTTQTLITDLCDKLAASECASPTEKQDCENQLAEDQSYAEKDGCGAELDAYLKCAGTKPIDCTTTEFGTSPHVSEDCSELRTKFGECYTRLDASCGVSVGAGGTGPSTCKITCPDVTSVCEASDPNGPADCTCDSGPRAGTKFQASNCGTSLIYETGHTCK